jgi:hypothetical protein
MKINIQHFQHSTINIQQSTFNNQHSTINIQQPRGKLGSVFQQLRTKATKCTPSAATLALAIRSKATVIA